MDSEFENEIIHSESEFIEYIKQTKQAEARELELITDYLESCNCGKHSNKVYDMIKNRFGSIRRAVACDYLGFFDSGSIDVNVLMHLLPPLTRFFRDMDPIVKRNSFTSVDDCVSHIINTLRDEVAEVLYVMYLSRDLELYHHIRMTDTSSSRVNMDIRMLIMHCPVSTDVKIIVAHNHGSYGNLPSSADLDLTAKLRDILGTLDIEFIDHIITYRNTAYGILSKKNYSV